jgi:hypothetical protein
MLTVKLGAPRPRPLAPVMDQGIAGWWMACHLLNTDVCVLIRRLPRRDGSGSVAQVALLGRWGLAIGIAVLSGLMTHLILGDAGIAARLAVDAMRLFGFGRATAEA